MIYSGKDITKAYLLSPLVTLPITVVGTALVSLLQGERLLSMAFSWGLIFSAVTVPTAYLATFLFATPFVISANSAGSPISAASAHIVGAVASVAVSIGWAVALFLRGTPNATTIPFVLVVGVLSGLATSHLFHRFLE